MATAQNIAESTGLDMETAKRVAEAIGLTPPSLTDYQAEQNDTSIWLDNANEQMLNEAENTSVECISASLVREWDDGEVDTAFIIRTAILAGIAIGKGDQIA